MLISYIKFDDVLTLYSINYGIPLYSILER